MPQKITQTYAKIIQYGIIASAFLPLIYYKNTFSPFHFTKVLFFRTIIEALFVFWIVLAIADKKYRPKPNLIFWLVNAWFLSYLITSFFGVDWLRSFWGTLERMGGFILQLHLWMFFIMLISVFKNKKDWFLLLKSSIIASFLCSLYALGQKASIGFLLGGGRERVFGTLGNPALFAGYTLFNFFWALYFILRQKTTAGWRKFLIVVAVLQFLTIFMTAVRGAIIALLLGLVVLAGFYVLLSKQKKLKLASLGVILLILVVGVSFFLAKDTSLVQENDFLNRITDISLQTKTVQTRLTTWGIAWDAFVDKPVFGWGPENFGVAFAAHFDPVFFEGFGSETFWDRAHNVFLNILTTQGVFGFAIYLALIFGVLFLLYKMFREGDDEARWLAAVMFVILVVYHVHTFFILDVFSTYLMLLIFFGFAYFIYRRFTQGDDEPDEKQINKPKNWLLTIGLVAVFILMFPLVISPYQTNYIGTRAVVSSWQSNHQLTIEKYRQALASESFPAYEIRHKLASYAYTAARNEQLAEEERIDVLNFAILEVQKNIQEHPEDYLPYLYVGRLYSYKGFFDPSALDLGLVALEKSLQLNSTYARTLYELGQVYVIKNDYQKALEIYQQGIKLNPEVGAGYWYIGAVYGFMENWQEMVEYAEVAKEKNYQFGKDEIIKVINAYNKLGQSQKVVWWSEYLTEIQPEAGNFASLAAAYRDNGNYQEAIVAAQKAAKLDPEGYGAQAQFFIGEIKKEQGL